MDKTLAYAVEWIFVAACLWLVPALFVGRSLEGRVNAARLLCVWAPLVMPVAALVWIVLRLMHFSAASALAITPLLFASLWRVRPGRDRETKEAVSIDFAAAVALGLVMLVASAAAYGTTVRPGKPVAIRGYLDFASYDQANYASVAAESVRSPIPENPFLAGKPMPTTYGGFAPAVALDAVFKVPILEAWSFFFLPTALFFVILSAWALGKALGLSRIGSLLAALLVGLGGDMTVAYAVMGRVAPYWYMSTGAPTSFYLLYNTWVVVLPTALAAIALAVEKDGVEYAPALAAIPVGIAFLTKPFMFPPVVAMLIAARPREWRRTVPAALAGLTAGVAASGLLGGDLS
ncbi:MAG: hypothetical protein ACYC1U_08035, partial [Candidatus Aquicultorales bacterium]